MDSERRPTSERSLRAIQALETDVTNGSLEQSLTAILDKISGRVLVGVSSGRTAVQVLATSRTPLRVQGEHELATEPLPLPPLEALANAETLGSNEAVRLFVDRARAVDATFRLSERNGAAVAELCRRRNRR